MILDAHNQFSSAQAVTAAAASTNYIDLGAARDIGKGEPLKIRVNITTALTDGSSDSTVTVALQQDSDSGFGGASSIQTLFTIAATAAAGTEYEAFIAPGVITQQYVRLYYTPNNGNLSTGAWDANIVLDAQDSNVYADNITIS